MRSFLAVFLTGFILVQSGICQQIPTVNDDPYFYSSNEVYSKYLINPGYSGFSKQHEFQIDFLGPFVGLENALRRSSLSYDGWFEKIKSGVGFIANVESYGNLDKRHEMSGFYSYRILQSTNCSLILGTKIGFVGRKIKNDIILIDNETLLGSGNWNNSPVMDLGITLKSEKLNVGFACKNLIESKIKLQSYETVLYSKGFVFDASYTLKPNDKLVIEPYFFDYYYESNSVSIGIKTELDKKYSMGLGYDTYYRKVDATVALRLFRHIQIGYLFEKYKENTLNGLLLKVMLSSNC
jgi:type IX secretion system PorP/SprF family membrane protein